MNDRYFDVDGAQLRRVHVVGDESQSRHEDSDVLDAQCIYLWWGNGR